MSIFFVIYTVSNALHVTKGGSYYQRISLFPQRILSGLRFPAEQPGCRARAVERRIQDQSARNTGHRLPDPYREVFWLRVYGELNFADIARLFEKTESWARVTYYRAKTKLREELT